MSLTKLSITYCLSVPATLTYLLFIQEILNMEAINIFRDICTGALPLIAIPSFILFLIRHRNQNASK
jgi:hypothetical protein